MKWNIVLSQKNVNEYKENPDYRLLIKFENGQTCEYLLWYGSNDMFKLEYVKHRLLKNPPIELTLDDILKDKRYRVKLLTGSNNLC